MLQPQALASLKQEYETAFSNIAEKTEKLEAFKGDYKDLKNRLKTLPDRLEYDALIPLGTKAFGFGKIVHTNEILCMLGDNWFMECSAKTACEIVDRRIKKCNQHLEEQKQEAERLENWKSSLTKLIVESVDNDSMEIVEEVNDEDYERLTKEHRESVRRYHQELAKSKEQKSPIQLKKEEEEFWARLDELELQEEIMQAEDTYKKRQLKSAQKAAVPSPLPGASTSSIKTKPRITKHVQFNAIPEVREIPSLADTKAMRYADVVASSSTSRAVDVEHNPPKKPPIHHVEGVSDNVVERSQPSASTPLDSVLVIEPVPVPTTALVPDSVPVAEIAKPSSQPVKKGSLFKQRRGANL